MSLVLWYYGGFPMPECVKCYLVYSGVFEFGCYPFALACKVSSHHIGVAVEDFG